VTLERLASYVRALQAINAPNTVLGRIQELRLALCVIAPERDWIWIRELERRLRRMANAARNRRAGVVSSKRLFSLGLARMAEAEAATTVTSVMRAVQFRDGLMIALLAARPLRRHNFAAIEIGRHLVRVGDVYWIIFAASETKTRTPIEIPFPVTLVPQLERYLSVYRPLLAAGDGYWKRRRAFAAPAPTLWLSQHGTAMAEVAMSDRFRKLTRARLGRPVTMHRFRDSAATSIATEDPEHVFITKSILGHTTLRSSERYYNHASSLQAARRYQAGILELRRKSAGGARTARAKATLPPSRSMP
jgi:integrase